MNEARAPGEGFLPGQHALDGYGKGGFGFAGMSHRGSILATPVGIFAWDVSEPKTISLESLRPVLEIPRGQVDLLLLGTGPDLVFVPKLLRQQIKEAGIVVEPMATGAAARTYNVLLAEGRRIAAALIAVP